MSGIRRARRRDAQVANKAGERLHVWDLRWRVRCHDVLPRGGARRTRAFIGVPLFTTRTQTTGPRHGLFADRRHGWRKGPHLVAAKRAVRSVLQASVAATGATPAQIATSVPSLRARVTHGTEVETDSRRLLG